jgi:GDP-L-fucose synthase
MAKIFVAGGTGLVGSNLLQHLNELGFENVHAPPRTKCDLLDKNEVLTEILALEPDVVIIAAGRVGGIHANERYTADFIYENIAIQTNIIDACKIAQTPKLICFGSACMYPRNAQQPVKESSLLTGPLEPTNESYAIAKIAGMMMCKAYKKQHSLNSICLVPTNLYGPGDNFDPQSGHVIPSLMRRAHLAKVSNHRHLEIWGSGKPRREFLHVSDLSSAIVFALSEVYDDSPLNIGTGKDISIADLAELIVEIVGYRGSLLFNTDKPDGMPLKMLDSKQFRSLGWSPQITLERGLENTYKWLLNHDFRNLS